MLFLFGLSIVVIIVLAFLVRHYYRRYRDFKSDNLRLTIENFDIKEQVSRLKREIPFPSTLPSFSIVNEIYAISVVADYISEFGTDNSKVRVILKSFYYSDDESYQYAMLLANEVLDTLNEEQI